TNEDGRSVRAKWVDAHAEENGKPWRIELKREADGLRFYMEKSQFHPAEWLLWQAYAKRLAMHDGVLNWEETYYEDVDMTATMNLEETGDLVCTHAGDTAKVLGDSVYRLWFPVMEIENVRFRTDE
ncbi:MAG: hypothetical protein NWS00_09050, partial [Opitutales bacterium]|nr:hypothetical protein [Opitutales bacterium]